MGAEGLTEHRLESAEVVAGCEGAEGFGGGAVRLVGFQHLFQCGLQLFDGNTLEDLASERFVIAEAATDKDVIAFLRFARDFDRGAEETDISDVMLGAGVRATSEVDVDWLVERDFFLQVISEFAGVFLGVGGGEFAVAVASAGDESAANVVLAPIQAGFEDGFLYGFQEGVGDIRNDDVLPGSEAEIAGGVVVGEVAKAEQLFWRDFSDGD